MAGSYNHAVNEKGQLRTPENLHQMLDTRGDWTEFAEEAYGMIWWLASQIAGENSGSWADPSLWVSSAQEEYRKGLEKSPGWESPDAKIS